MSNELELLAAQFGFMLPASLRSAMATEIWQESPANVISTAMPFLHAEIEFLTLERMLCYNRRDYPDWQTDDAEEREINDLTVQSMHQFRIYYGSHDSSRNDLPWLDYERAFMIADNLNHGDDYLCVFLDIRPSLGSPRVVAPQPSTKSEFCYDWIHVSDSFEHFWRGLVAADQDIAK